MKTALIVDDLKQNIYLLRTILLNAGYEVVEASNGSEALELARHNPPDIIISDILMPVMDGFSLCRACKQDEHLQPIPFVFYTATYTDAKDEELALKLGAARFIVKSVVAEEFTTIIAEVLRQHESGKLPAPPHPPEEETSYYRLYNEVLIHKLEHKLVQLEREKAERERTEESLNLRLAALKAAANAIIITNRDGVIQWVNPAFVTLTGYTLEESLGRNPRELVRSGRHNRAFYAHMWQTVVGGQVWHGEIINRRKDGSYYTEEQTITPVRDKAGQISHFVAIKQDITERKQTEAALLEAQQQLQQAVSAGNVGLWDWDLRANRVSYSAEWKQQIGYEAHEISDDFNEWQDRVHPDDLERCLQTVQAFIANPWPNYQLEFRFRHKDGSYRTILATASLLFDETGRPSRMVGAHLDITSLKQLETEKEALAAQFYQTQKMESIGRLAGGIAHDFNNLLVPILGYAEIGMMSLPAESALYGHFSQIKAAGDRAANLTRQILAFSRQQILEMTIVNLNEVVLGFQKMLNRLIRENIELKTQLAPKLKPIKADAGQIEQVLLNLAINAQDAMPDGGQLTIETSNVVLDENYAAQHADTRPGQHVLLTVSDTGHGMDTATRQRIFEPFFTTKERGKGTGLGLSTVFGIVKQHGGNIWVYSEPGLGTTFKVYWPVAEAAVAADIKPQPDIVLLGGTETVLVVEDETSVRQLVGETLLAQGYHVLLADEPEKGLSLAATHDGPIHLLLSDVVLPKMNGPELYRRLVSVRPDLKVLYVSGYTDDTLEFFHVMDEGTAFLQKPFAIRSLLHKVRTVLE